MPWRGPYYYRSVWVDGKPRQVYVGRGPDAELVARLEQVEVERRQLRRQGCDMARQEDEALDALLGELNELTEILTVAAMTAAGYHRHDRGEWRRRRGQH
jgi:hypothetical protein